MNASLKELCVDIQLKRKTELLEKISNFTILGNQTFESGLTPPSINVGRYLALQFPNCRSMQDFEQRQYVGIIFI